MITPNRITAEQAKAHILEAMTDEERCLQLAQPYHIEENRIKVEIGWAFTLLGFSAADMAIAELPDGFQSKDGVFFVREHGRWRLRADKVTVNSVSVGDFSGRSKFTHIEEMLGLVESPNARACIKSMLEAAWTTTENVRVSMCDILLGVPEHLHQHIISHPCLALHSMNAEQSVANVRLLAQAAMDIGLDPTSAEYGTPAMVSLPFEQKGLEALDVFIRYGYSLEARVPDAMTALMSAASSRDERVIRHLLLAGANPHAVDGDGNGVLHLAIIDCMEFNEATDLLGTLTLLIEAGADPERANSHGRTARELLDVLLHLEEDDDMVKELKAAMSSASPSPVP